MNRQITLWTLVMSVALMMVSCDGMFGGSYTKGGLDHSNSKILFKREGGGCKTFYAYTNSGHEIFMNVTRYDFRDTNYTTSVFVEDKGKLSNLIANILDNKVNITGDFKQPTGLSGTWAYIYVVSEDGILTEITNVDIREDLMALESLVVKGR